MPEFKHGSAKQGFPLEVKLDKGRYKWCGCGKTKKVPWCDGTCKDGKPVKFEVKKKGTYRICNCGLTKTPPYCDGSSHGKLEKKAGKKK